MRGSEVNSCFQIWYSRALFGSFNKKRHRGNEKLHFKLRFQLKLLKNWGHLCFNRNAHRPQRTNHKPPNKSKHRAFVLKFYINPRLHLQFIFLKTIFRLYKIKGVHFRRFSLENHPKFPPQKRHKFNINILIIKSVWLNWSINLICNENGEKKRVIYI